MKAEVNGYKLEIPDPPVVAGWEAVEYRFAKQDEYYCHMGTTVRQATCNLTYPWWIMRRKEPPIVEIRYTVSNMPSAYPSPANSVIYTYLTQSDEVFGAYDVSNPTNFKAWLRREVIREGEQDNTMRGYRECMAARDKRIAQLEGLLKRWCETSYGEGLYADTRAALAKEW